MTLAAGQFLMTLDSSVLNVSIATVAKDVGTDGPDPDRDHALHAGNGVVDDHRRQARSDPRPQTGPFVDVSSTGCGSLTTARSPRLGALILGWSFLELKSTAKVELAAGVPFVSNADLETALDKNGVPTQAADAIVDENATARIDGLRSSLSVLAVSPCSPCCSVCAYPPNSGPRPGRPDPTRPAPRGRSAGECGVCGVDEAVAGGAGVCVEFAERRDRGSAERVCVGGE